MHRSESRELVSCSVCGAEIAPGTDRSFAYASDACLCFACAVSRGGAYDEVHDRWSSEPDTHDLARPD